jgi:hypothetical protein
MAAIINLNHPANTVHWHFLVVIGLVAAHVLLVRKHGIVPPFQLSDGTETPVSQPRSGTKTDSAPTERIP